MMTLGSCQAFKWTKWVFHIHLQGWECVTVCLIYHCILHHLTSWTSLKSLVTDNIWKIHCPCFYKKVPKCLYGSKTMIVHLLPNSFSPHSERRGGWMVLFRQCFEYFYSLLPSIMFLFFEEEPPEIPPSFSLIQDSSDSATSYRE